jgi:protein involved in polysaccharide export with SLBB domain
MPQSQRDSRRCWSKPAAILTLGFLLFAGVGQERASAQEPLVSLSAGKIIEILRREPGLLLKVKRLLVTKAYEQGRLLDPADLSDDALFELLREDNNIRVLATEEIEKREYVRPKPTRQEMKNDGIGRVPASELAKAAGSGAIPGLPSEEETYWAQHERRAEEKSISATDSSAPDSRTNDGFSKIGFEPELATPPNPWPVQPAPPASPDSGRRQSLAGLQPQNRDSYAGARPEGGALPRVSPEGMPGLLSASLDESVSTSQKSSSGDAPWGSPYSAASTSRLRASSPAQSYSASAADAAPAATTRPDTRMQRPAPSPPDEDRPPLRRRLNPYAEVPSLYDLYTQISRRSPALGRFGEDIFRNGTGNFDELPMDLPVGPDYVLGPGDGLSIELWGGISERLQRVVDREGRVALPEAGAVDVTGRSLGDVQQLVQSALRRQFHEVHADVSLARLRTVRVYVVGDVVRPGAYDVSSLSTPLNALYQAGGPTSRGSLRILRHYRGPQLIGQIDLYDLLLHGVRSSLERLQAGDTIMVPPLGAELTIEGMVRRPAVYELNREANLAEALELAGGVLTTGTLRHIEVERVIAHESRSMLRLDLPEKDPPELDLAEKDRPRKALPEKALPENNHREAVTRALENFKIQDGDKVRISPVLPYSQQTVYLDGHVVHPGKHAYREGMRITDLIASYSDLLPEPAPRHAEIIRLAAPDYAPQVIAFNLADALAGERKGSAKDNETGGPNARTNQNVTLQPFDTVRIFSRYEFEDAPLITVSGEVRHPGEHVTNGETHLRDALYLAGGVTREALLTDAQVFRRTEDGKLKVLSVNLERALAGNAADNVALEPKDRVFIHRNLSKVDPATVKIEGEVAWPGKYPLGEDMSAAQLVRLAGGLKRGAFTEAADLTRFTVENGAELMGEHVAVPLARALAGEADADVRLHDGDVLTIRQLAGWTDVGSLITVKGEVMHPGDYGIQESERLSSVIARAGGLRSDAYPYGAILERRQVRELEEKNRADLIRQVQGQEASFKLLPDTGDAEERLAKSATLQQWHATLEQLQNVPPTGRLVIHISRDVRRWANTPADLEVRAGDTLFIPKSANYVMVNGQVYNPTAITYRPGKSAGWYLRQAGGPTNLASRKALFVVRADGSVVGGKGSSDWFTGNVLSAELRPGDMVFVPEKALGGPPIWKNALQAAQLLSSVAVAVSVGHGF